MLAKISALLAAIVSLLVILGFGYGYIDKIYAKEEKVKRICETTDQHAVKIQKVELRLDQKIVQDRYYDYQKRQWELEKQYGNLENMPNSAKEEYQRNQQEIERLKSKLEIIQDKM